MNWKELRSFCLINILQIVIIFDDMFRIGSLFDDVIFIRSQKYDDEWLISNEWFQIIVDVVGIPIITSIISLFVAAASDTWPSKHGRRVSIMKWALIPYIIGCIIYLITGIYPVIFISNNDYFSQETNTILFYVSLSFYFIGYFCSFIGRNIISIMFKSYILDTFSTEQQDKVNLVKSFMTGVAYVLWNGFFLLTFSLGTYNWNSSKETSESNEIIEKGMSLLLLIGSAISDILLVAGVFFFEKIVNEDQFDPSFYENIPQTKTECIKQSLKNVLEGIKTIDFGVFSVFIILFFGWVDWYSFTKPIMYMERTYLYPGPKYMDERMLVYSTNYTIVGILVMIESFVLYVTKWRLDKFTVLSYLLCSISSLLFIGLDPQKNDADSFSWKNYFLSSIPFFFSSMILTALKSFPYSLMRDFVPENKHGVTMGFMHIFINLGQLISYLFIFMTKNISKTNQITIIEDSNDQYYDFPNQYSFVFLLCIISLIVSFNFYYLRKSLHKQSQNGEYYNKEKQKLLEMDQSKWK